MISVIGPPHKGMRAWHVCVVAHGSLGVMVERGEGEALAAVRLHTTDGGTDKRSVYF